MSAKKTSLLVLMASVEAAGAGDVESITLEQAAQIHGAGELKQKVSAIVDDIIEGAKNDTPTGHIETVDLLSNIDIAFTALISSLGANKTEVTKASNTKLVAANKPAPAKPKKAEKQIDIEDEPAE